MAPAGNNLVVGLKPTVGLVSQSGIIPIAHSQDTAGPIGPHRDGRRRNANTLKSPFGKVARHELPHDYTDFLDDDALEGARIGIDRRQFEPHFGAFPDVIAVIEQAIDDMADARRRRSSTPSTRATRWTGLRLRVPRAPDEFKHDIAVYLKTLGNTACVPWRT